MMVAGVSVQGLYGDCRPTPRRRSVEEAVSGKECKKNLYMNRSNRACSVLEDHIKCVRETPGCICDVFIYRSCRGGYEYNEFLCINRACTVEAIIFYFFFFFNTIGADDVINSRTRCLCCRRDNIAGRES